MDPFGPDNLERVIIDAKQFGHGVGFLIERGDLIGTLNTARLGNRVRDTANAVLNDLEAGMRKEGTVAVTQPEIEIIVRVKNRAIKADLPQTVVDSIRSDVKDGKGPVVDWTWVVMLAKDRPFGGAL